MEEPLGQTRISRLRSIASRIPTLFLGGVLLWAAIQIRGALLDLQQAGERQTARIEALEASSAALTEDLRKVEAEVRALREGMAVETAEDVIFLKIMVSRPDLDRGLAKKIARAVRKHCAVHAQDPDLVLAMMMVESKFDPNAVSSRGAVGLMQITPHWRQILGISGELTDPDVSIRYGLQIFGFYREMYKDMSVALTAYHRGPQAVDRALMRGDDPKSRYAPEVLAAYEMLKSMTSGS